MSGKLIMKRKMDKNMAQSSNPSEDTGRHKASQEIVANEEENKDYGDNDTNNVPIQNPHIKRIRCDTPPPEPEDDIHPPIVVEPSQEDFENNRRNRQLLEAIQAKMFELQRELDEFEDDFDSYNDDYYNLPNPEEEQNVISDEDARALGYAMCAQETILFLQREGISPESLLYTRLRDALVGRELNEHVFKT
ncbi:insensible [Haematobia irritans]|uniref:insensible n=1 Tax=Haematobia irritans TaxID=7368 RepID=UPI003F4F6593